MVMRVAITGRHSCVDVPHPLILCKELLYIVGDCAEYPAHTNSLSQAGVYEEALHPILCAPVMQKPKTLRTRTMA